MFYKKYCIFQDGEYLTGEDDETEAIAMYESILTEWLDKEGNEFYNHTFQLLNVMMGLE